MVALPDMSHTSLNVAQDRNEARGRRGRAGLGRALKMGLGSALVMASIGIWAVEAGAGDAGMQLVKLLVTAVLLITGLIFISGLDDRSDAPEIHIDPINRQVRIVTIDGSGRPAVSGCHDIEDLKDLHLRDGLLTARGAQGQRLFTVPVNDPAIVEALHAAL